MQLLQPVGHLVRRPHLHPAVAVDRHDAGMRLEIALVRELRAEGVLEDAIGLAEPGLDVAQLETQHGLDVRVGPLGRRAFVRAGVLVHDGRATIERLGEVDGGRQVLVLHVDRATASSAISGSAAATTATFSPMKRTRSRARSGMSNMRRPTSTSGRSAAVSTASTPGSARALEVSIRRIRACGSGLRSALPQISPGSVTSAEKRAAPVTFAAPSSRPMGCPTIRCVIDVPFLQVLTRGQPAHHPGVVRRLPRPS